jgi:hypothetical protein
MATQANPCLTPIPPAPSSRPAGLPHVSHHDPLEHPADAELGNTHAEQSKIVTSYWAKPIPVRQFDWTATYDGDEPNDAGQMAVGHGATEAEAITDLIAGRVSC